MNELIFLAQLIAMVCSLLISLRLGPQATTALISILTLLMNLFVLKQIRLFGMTVTASDAFGVGITLALNVLQECFGKKEAQRAIVISFFTTLVYLALAILHLQFTPHTADTMHLHFVPLLSAMPRIIAASLCTYLIVMYTDAQLYGWLKTKTHGRLVIIRNYASITVTQALDTVLFSLLGLYGMVESISHVIILSFSAKLAAIIVATPAIALAKIIMSRSAKHPEISPSETSS